MISLKSYPHLQLNAQWLRRATGKDTRKNGGVMRAFLFDALLADGHLDDIIQFSFTIAIMKVFW